MTTKHKSATKKSFSKQYEELEKLAEEFESGDLDLEQSIPKFKKALELSRELQERLKEMENEVTKMKADYKDVSEDA